MAKPEESIFKEEVLEGRDTFLGVWDQLCISIKQINNKDLLYSTGNSTQYSVIIYMRKE